MDMEWLESFIRNLGSDLGSSVASYFRFLIENLFLILIFYLVWGLPWHQIIARAGYKENAMWYRLIAIMLPIFFIIPLVIIYGERSVNSDLSDFLAIVSFLAFYINLWSLAIPRWPSQRRDVYVLPADLLKEFNAQCDRLGKNPQQAGEEAIRLWLNSRL